MIDSDVRWKQRFQNFTLALAQLLDAVELQNERPLSLLEQQGFVREFEFTHELAWNVMKDYFFYQGNASIMGSRDATREAFQAGMIGDGWMDMIVTRDKAVHTYDAATVSAVIQKTSEVYCPLFVAFEKKMQSLIDEK